VEPVIQLEKTVDILKELGQRKEWQFLVGFAAESGPVREKARKKLQEKGLDLIVGNNISRDDQGFQSDLNQVILIDCEGKEEELPRLPKTDIAAILWDRIQQKEHRIQNTEYRIQKIVAHSPH